MRRLIVNADDLGLTVGVNQGIFEAHARGILTSASVMAVGPALDDALDRARRQPLLGLGCHLTLVDGRPVSAPGQVPTLVDREGRFRPSWKPFIGDALAGRISIRDVERELTAQVERLLAAGVRLTHLDSHKHVHAYPPHFAVAVTLAARYGVPSIRVPFERPVAPVLLSSAGVTNLAMWPWAAVDRRRAVGAGLHVARFTGRTLTGSLTGAALLGLMQRLPPGTTELMVHPGRIDSALRAMPTRLLDSRAQELAALCAPDTLAAIRSARISLVRHDLRPAHPPEDERAS